MAAYELRGAVHHYIGSMLNGSEYDRCEGVVDYQHRVVFMCYLRNGVDVCDVGVWVAEGLHVYRLRIGPDGCLEGLEVVHIDDVIAHALCGEGVCDKVIRAAVEVVGSDDMVAVACYVLQRIGDGSGTRGYCEACHATFQGCHAFLKHTLCGICQTAIDIACIAKTETVGSMLGVFEHIRRCLIDRYSTGICSRVGHFLTHMKGQRLNMEILFLCTHSLIPFFYYIN